MSLHRDGLPLKGEKELRKRGLEMTCKARLEALCKMLRVSTFIENVARLSTDVIKEWKCACHDVMDKGKIPRIVAQPEERYKVNYFL